jgi:hypothetical protein
MPLGGAFTVGALRWILPWRGKIWRGVRGLHPSRELERWKDLRMKGSTSRRYVVFLSHQAGRGSPYSGRSVV